jgi:Ca2+/Na+ antiporter
MTLLVAAFSLHGSAGERAVAYTTRPGLLLALGIVLLAAASVWAGTRTLRLGCRIHGDVRSVLAAHQPLLVVYGGLLGLLLLGVVLGSVGFNLIILVHVTAWLVFVYHQLKKRPPVPARNLWTWLRATPAGFLTLHLGLVLLILVLMALRVHVWERAGLVSELFASANFHYWSVMHISMAFWRSRN